METLQEVAHAKTWCGQVQLARWGQIIFKVASKKREDTYNVCYENKYTNHSSNTLLHLVYLFS